MSNDPVSAKNDPTVISKQIAFATPWFEVIAKRIPSDQNPFYALRMQDYVTVVAFTPAKELVLVRQYRPVVERYTLELPSGHVEKDETPADSASRELREECGFHSGKLELLGTLISDTGRNENRLWCYLARHVLPVGAGYLPEPGLETILVPPARVRKLIVNAELDHALNLAALMLAVVKHGTELMSISPAENGHG